MNQHARPTPVPIPFIDVAAQRRRLGAKIDEAIDRVLAHCQFIMGPEVGTLEADLSAFCGARHAITCASGTDALLLALMARGVGAGDAVICPAFTFTATAEVVALVGAVPVFADVDAASFNLDPGSAKRAIATARKAGLAPKAIIAVDMFGQPADHAALATIAAAENLFVLDDAAQSFGATYGNRRVGTLAPLTATSFFPAKPLGCYGDGGAVFTDDDELAAVMRSLRVHGEGRHRYEAVRIGINGRFDTIQAAVLIEKLKIFPDEIAARNAVARRYNAELADLAPVPQIAKDATSVWAQYTIRLPAGQRDQFTATLRAQGIPTAIYYPIPLNRQVAYRHFPVAAGGVPVCDRLAEEVVSLPMHAYLDEPTQDRIIAACREALAG
ncbi:MAG TPA: DegT/DnrJ/EryC1/StrS family aminotransferase [Xanthobacteraceae bacterium]|jgi:dTDP-4-amino-4,6-dideoxygalactose transaminase|nr:DegT/DnrJ/EryC1/StrS family aminotransferase [Xanthobacteraceae bacterium]